ncbi:hypothetical protein BC332_00824 [Capsicum chinense]|nr:hypothetical protein BC332_00824 [Capsicum chinense]
MFRQIIFGSFLDMPQCNYQSQLSKCLLMFEIHQDNPEEIQVYVQEIILKFSIIEYDIISGLKCSGSIEEHLFSGSSRINGEIFFRNKKLDFVIVKNGSYEQFSWGKSSFEKLIVTWRQDFLVEKQLYSMGGMSHVLNVWMYECCSEVDSAIAERVENVIPRIFNWKVVGIKVKYENFMGGIFSKFVYNNIRPTHEEVQSLDLQMIEEFELNDDEYGFSLETVAGRSEILKKTGLLSDASASQHTKRRRTVRFDFAIIEEQVYQKTPSSVSTRTVSTQKTPSSDSKRVHAEKTTSSSSSKSVRHDNSDETWDEMKLFFQSYVDRKFNFLHDLTVKQHQESNEKVDKQHAELIQMLKHNNQINEKDVEGCCEDIATARLDALVKFVVNQNSANPNVGTPSTVHINKDQMGVEGISADIGPATLESLVTVVENLKPNSANIGTSTMQLPPDFPDAIVAAHQAAKTPAKRTRTRSKYIDVIFYYLRKKSKLRNDQDYRFTTTNYFFKNYIVKTHSNYYEDDTDTVITTQQDYAQSVDVVLNEDATTNIIKGYCMSSGLPWHQVDEVYVPINCNNKFHWVLTVIVLKDRRICVYDSLSSLRNMKSINEINKDREVFVVGYAEYLSEGMNVPSDDFEAKYHRMCYTTLFRKYGIQKAQKGYVSENDDPPRPRSRNMRILSENEIASIE